MKDEELITLIEAEWDSDKGFFGRLRQGQFDRASYLRCKQSLDRLHWEIGKKSSLSRRLVSIVWYIPLFMTWQTERVSGSIDAEEYRRVSNEIQTIVQEFLGVP
jgi:hypothetical protein